MAKQAPLNGWTKVIVGVICFAGVMYAQGQVTNTRLKAIEETLGIVTDLQATSGEHTTAIALLEASRAVNPESFNEAVKALTNAANALTERARKGG